MSAAPEIVEWPARPYVAIPVNVTMAEIGTVVPPLNGEVFRWLAERGAGAAGAPFWKYNVIDMDRELEIEAGVTVRRRWPVTAGWSRAPCRAGGTRRSRTWVIRASSRGSQKLCWTGRPVRA